MVVRPGPDPSGTPLISPLAQVDWLHTVSSCVYLYIRQLCHLCGGVWYVVWGVVCGLGCGERVPNTPLG